MKFACSLAPLTEALPLTVPNEPPSSRAETWVPGAGDDVDDAAHRVGAVERALGPAQHLDALDVVGKQAGKVEFGPERRIVHRNAVDEDLGLVALRPADADLGQLPRRPRPVDGEPRHLAQRIGDEADLLLPQVRAGDHRDGAADLVACGRSQVGGHRDLGKRHHGGVAQVGVLGMRGKRKRQRAENGGKRRGMANGIGPSTDGRREEGHVAVLERHAAGWHVTAIEAAPWEDHGDRTHRDTPPDATARDHG
mgnify:CR=1 FL=1